MINTIGIFLLCIGLYGICTFDTLDNSEPPSAFKLIVGVLGLVSAGVIFFG